MARSPRTFGQPSDDEFAQLMEHAGPVEVPENLGNLPSDAELNPGPSDPQIATAPVEEPPAEYEDEPPASEPRSVEDRMAALERENEFLRLGIQRQPAPPPPSGPQRPEEVVQLLDQQLGGFKVTPQDVELILRDPALGAEYLQNGIRAAVAAGAALALQQARSEFAQFQGAQQQATQLRDAFYGQHPDLAPYAKLVLATATDVRAQGISDAGVLIKETAQRVRGQLREWGITPKRPDGSAAPAPTRAGGRPRRQPAYAEGAGPRLNGRPQLNNFERELFQLRNAQ